MPIVERNRVYNCIREKEKAIATRRTCVLLLDVCTFWNFIKKKKSFRFSTYDPHLIFGKLSKDYNLVYAKLIWEINLQYFTLSFPTLSQHFKLEICVTVSIVSNCTTQYERIQIFALQNMRIHM